LAFRFSGAWPVEASVVDGEGTVLEGSHDASGRYGSADRHSVVRGSELACRLSAGRRP